MKPSTHKARRVFGYTVLVALLLVTVGMPLWALRVDMVQRWNDELRQLKTKRLQSARALQVLQDHPTVISKVAEAPATVESLTLSLVESINAQAISIPVNLNSLSVTDSTVSHKGVSEPSTAHSLRIEFSASMNKAIDVLALFDSVRQVADWRAMEVRGCTITRVVELGRLSANCSVELYYFAGLDT